MMTPVEALTKVTAALPAAEDRPGQREMSDAVASAIDHGRHLIVQAGTGTGKTMAYLVPAVLTGKRVVVATATKALQDQLAAKDLPFLQAHLGRPFDWAILKGRSNYICMAASYGAGNYGMCGRAFGPRFLFAWPNAKTAVMGPQQLAGVLSIVARQSAASLGRPFDEAADEELRRQVEDQIERESLALFMTGRVYDDGIIDPRDTRTVLGMAARLQIRRGHRDRQG